jgi:hypothetical protein
VPPAVVEALPAFGLSSICNVLAAIKTAKYYSMGPGDVIVTVATDGAAMYGTERDKALQRYEPAGFNEVAAGEAFAQHLLGVATDHLLETSWIDRNRIFNLGYFTWVEQQGVSIEEFLTRRDQGFWKGLRELMPIWDEMIVEFNARTGAGRGR